MRTYSVRLVGVLCLFVLIPTAAQGQELTREQQIAAAAAPAPLEMQEGAAVMGYADGHFTTLREGTNDLICLSDEPGDDRFHVACYHKGLEPFMARGRELEAMGTERAEILSIREAEIMNGTLPMPEGPSALYSMTGPAGSFDPATGEVTDAGRLYVVYIPYATPESTGLTTTPAPGMPWLMNPGKPWAHIMLMPGED